MPCQIPYIPERLHSNERPDINQFYIGEFLFRRCKEEEKENPFKHIKLFDLSVNRSGPEANVLSEPNDVLLNTDPDNGLGQVYDLSIAFLRIMELDNENQYKKSLDYTKEVNGVPVTNTCALHLKHKKDPCNYSHSVFVVYFDDVEMTFENFNDFLGNHKRLRTWAKNEFAKMVVKEEVWINWENKN